jgi:hypothetical protein
MFIYIAVTEELNDTHDCSLSQTSALHVTQGFYGDYLIKRKVLWLSL